MSFTNILYHLYCNYIKSGTFRCNNGIDIGCNIHCDGMPDCPSGEDEASCPSQTYCTTYILYPLPLTRKGEKIILVLSLQFGIKNDFVHDCHNRIFHLHFFLLHQWSIVVNV